MISRVIKDSRNKKTLEAEILKVKERVEYTFKQLKQLESSDGLKEEFAAYRAYLDSKREPGDRRLLGMTPTERDITLLVLKLHESTQHLQVALNYKTFSIDSMAYSLATIQRYVVETIDMFTSTTSAADIDGIIAALNEAGAESYYMTLLLQCLDGLELNGLRDTKEAYTRLSDMAQTMIKKGK